MAECLITAGWDCPACDEKFTVPGIEKDEIFIGNHSEITAYTETIPGEIDALTFVLTKGFKKLCFHKDTGSFTEELVVANNAGSHFTQSFVGRTIDDSTAVRVAIEEFVDVDVVIVFKKKNGSFVLLGQNGGISLTVNSKSTGAATGDDTGDSLEFTGLGLGKANYFFDTSEAATQALLDGYVV